MWQELTNSLHDRHLQWKLSSLEWMSCLDTDEHIHLALPLNDTIQVPRVQSITAIGMQFHVDGDCVEQFESKLVKANSAFWAYKDYWFSKNINWKDKVSKYTAKILPVLLAGSPTWFLSQYKLDKMQL